MGADFMAARRYRQSRILPDHNCLSCVPGGRNCSAGNKTGAHRLRGFVNCHPWAVSSGRRVIREAALPAVLFATWIRGEISAMLKPFLAVAALLATVSLS